MACVNFFLSLLNPNIRLTFSCIMHQYERTVTTEYWTTLWNMLNILSDSTTDTVLSVVNSRRNFFFYLSFILPFFLFQIAVAVDFFFGFLSSVQISCYFIRYPRLLCIFNILELGTWNIQLVDGVQFDVQIWYDSNDLLTHSKNILWSWRNYHFKSL